MICKLCRKEIPDGSIYCMFCGKKQNYAPKKHKNRGNGQGTVYQLPNGKWRATVTLGYDENKKRKTISRNFDKKTDAVNALPTLKTTPKIDNSITFKQCLDKVLEHKKTTISKQAYNTYNSYSKKFKPIFYMKITDIRLEHLQNAVDSAKPSGKRIMKTLAEDVFKSAMKNDVVQKDYAQYIDVGKKESKKHESLTVDEIKEIKKYADKGRPYCDYIMCLIFTGMRPIELFALKKEDYFDGCFHGGAKTDAGKNRVVPVHPLIQPYVDKLMQSDSEYIFPNRSGKQMKRGHFSDYYFKDAIKGLNVRQDLTPYCCRHTFATLMGKIDSNDKLSMQRLMGHTNFNMTAHYTHTDVEQFKAIMNAIELK